MTNFMILINLETIFNSKASQFIYTDKRFKQCVFIWGIYWNRLGKNDIQLDILILT